MKLLTTTLSGNVDANNSGSSSAASNTNGTAAGMDFQAKLQELADSHLAQLESLRKINDAKVCVSIFDYFASTMWAHRV